jgi:hypothetical protein
MRWRAPFIVLLILLLLLPLAWVIHVALLVGGTSPPDAKIAPVLSPDERRRLMTYERACDGSGECEPPLGCFFNTQLLHKYCTDSRCKTDQDCQEGTVCLTFRSVKGGPRVRYCSREGLRKEGEPCIDVYDAREAGCIRELLCQSRRCGRPCRLEEPASCPEGFFCRKGPDGPSCLPTCEGRACPDGRQCVQFEEGVSVCAEVHGRNCQRTPCPGEQKCSVRDSFEHPKEVWMTCLIPCGGGNSSCPEGFICQSQYCRKSCDPGIPEACGPHYKCHRYKTGPWTCYPDL